MPAATANPPPAAAPTPSPKPAPSPSLSARQPLRTGIPEAPGHDVSESSIPIADRATDADLDNLANEINREPDRIEGDVRPKGPDGVEMIDPKSEIDFEAPELAEVKKEPAKTATEKKPDAKPEEKKAEPDEIDKIANDPKTPRKLREAYHKNREENKRLAAEVESLKSKAPGKDDPESVRTLSERLESERKRAADMEAKLAFVDYSQSKEFQDGYKKPYESAMKEAYVGLQGLKKADGSDLTDPEIQSLLLSGERDAYRMIDSMFDTGDSRLASRLIQDVYSLNRAMNRRLEDQKGRAEELHKQSKAQQTEREARYKTVFDDAGKKIVEKYKEVYDLETSDTERQKIIQDGYRYVDAAFTPPPNLSADQVAMLRADIRHRAGIMPDLKHRLDQANSKISTLEAELARFRKSLPGKGEVDTGGDESEVEEGTMEGSFRMLDKMV